MFSSKLQALASVTVLLACSLQVNAHAAFAPALGVTGTLARSDALRAKGNCGGANVGAINTSTAVAAAADGSFTVTAQNFNGGADGSRKVASASVDATGAGKTFSGTVTITKNGDGAPTSNAAEQITAQLPAGTKCTGGTSKNLCLVSLTTTAGFGNCVVVSQGAAAGGAAAAAPAKAAGGAAVAAGAAKAAPAKAAPAKAAPAKAAPAKAAPAKAGKAKAGKAKAGKAKKGGKAKKTAKKTAKKAGKRDVVGTRAPRAYRRLAEEVEAEE